MKKIDEAELEEVRELVRRFEELQDGFLKADELFRQNPTDEFRALRKFFLDEMKKI